MRCRPQHEAKIYVSLLLTHQQLLNICLKNDADSPDILDQLPRIQCPTTVLVGESTGPLDYSLTLECASRLAQAAVLVGFRGESPVSDQCTGRERRRTHVAHGTTIPLRNHHRQRNHSLIRGRPPVVAYLLLLRAQQDIRSMCTLSQMNTKQREDTIIRTRKA